MKTASESIGKWPHRRGRRPRNARGSAAAGRTRVERGTPRERGPVAARGSRRLRAEGVIEREWAAGLVPVDTLFRLAEYERMADLAEGFDEPEGR